MLHFHGAQINPPEALYQLAGRSFCVSYAYPQPVARAHQIGQSVLLDNGAWTFFTQGMKTDWDGYIEWATPWLEYPTTWAIIPDVIGGTGEENDELLRWFEGRTAHLNRLQLSPVWHINQPVERLVRLCAEYWRVCVGSGAFTPGSPPWRRIMNEAMDALCGEDGPVPNWLHLLRGIKLSGDEYPFASVDSASLARAFKGNNQGDPGFDLKKRASIVDSRQCPARWKAKGDQLALDYELPDKPYDHFAKRRSVGDRLFGEEEG